MKDPKEVTILLDGSLTLEHLFKVCHKAGIHISPQLVPKTMPTGDPQKNKTNAEINTLATGDTPAEFNYKERIRIQEEREVKRLALMEQDVKGVERHRHQMEAFAAKQLETVSAAVKADAEFRIWLRTHSGLQTQYLAEIAAAVVSMKKSALAPVGRNAKRNPRHSPKGSGRSR
jgi:hypothetical protein